LLFSKTLYTNVEKLKGIIAGVQKFGRALAPGDQNLGVRERDLQ